jgi:hypothetical protein
MKIHYQDDYHETIYTAYNKEVVPRIGDAIMFDEEDYRIKDVIWAVEIDEVIVMVTQNLVKNQKEDGTDTRLAEVKSAILNLDKKVKTQEKKSKLLSEQLVSVRSYLKTQKAQKPNES